MMFIKFFKLHAYTVAFIAILILAAIPRLVELLGHNYLFGFDQGLFYQAVKSIVVDHKLTLIGAPVGGQGGFFQGAGWYYLLAIPFLLTSGDPYGGMVLIFIISLGAVGLGVYLGTKMFGNVTGLLFGLLLATNISLISQARFIWPPFPISLLSVLYLFFLFQVIGGKKNYLALVFLTIGIMFHFETAAGITLLLEFLLFFPALIYKRVISFQSALLSLGAFLLTQLPLLFFDLRHHFLITSGIIHQFGKPPLNSGHQVTLLYTEAMYRNHLAVFISHFMTTFPDTHTPWFILAGILLIGVVCYLRSKTPTKQQKFFVMYLILSPFLLFAAFMLYLWPMWTWWILELSIIYLLLLSILLGWLFSLKGISPVIVSIILGLFFVFYIDKTAGYYMHDLHDVGGTAKIKGKIEAIDTIYKDANKKPFGLLVFTPPVYTYEYDYLLWWYGRKKYGYVPPQEKLQTFYLLIAPDPEKPWSYKGWLETVIKTGTIEKTWQLPTGFIIQKRNSL